MDITFILDLGSSAVDLVGQLRGLAEAIAPVVLVYLVHHKD